MNVYAPSDSDSDGDSVLEIPAFSISQDATGDHTPTEQRSTISVNPGMQREREEYNNYVSLIDDDYFDDTEDPSFLAAIEASLVDQHIGTKGETSTAEQEADNNQSVNTILQSFQRDNLH